MGVTASTPDDVHFSFQHELPTKPAYYLEFHSRGITRERQVRVFFNDIHIADVVPNRGQGYQEQRINLPTRFLHVGGLNEVLFEHADNPPEAVPLGRCRPSASDEGAD